MTREAQGALAVSSMLDSAPYLSTETKLMQQYRIAAAVHGGGDICAIRNGAGQVEIFTTATGGEVWNFYPDPTSDTGYSATKTGLSASKVAAGVNAQGRIVVFAANNLVLNYVTETGKTGDARWGGVQTATLPQMRQPITIGEVYTQTIGGSLYVAVMTQVTNAFPGKTYALSYCSWATSPGTFTATTVTLQSLNCVWSGSSASTAAFNCVDQFLFNYNVSTQTPTTYSTPPQFTSLAVDTVVDSAGNNQFYAVLSDGNIYQLIGSTTRSWAQVTQGKSFRTLRAVNASNGATNLFALDTSSKLWHVEPMAGGGWNQPAILQTNAAVAEVANNDAGDVEVFVVGTAQATMTHMIQDVVTGDWQSFAVSIPKSGQVEEYTAYSTDVTAFDAAGAVMPGAGVQVRASSQTIVTVNGATYFIDANTPANLTTGPAGNLTLTQQTGSLGIAALQIGFTSAAAATQAIGLRQSTGVQDRLAKLTSGDLQQAKEADGSYLLQEKYRTKETCDSLTKAFGQCMAVADATAVRLDASRMPAAARRRGVGHCAVGDAAHINRISPSAGDAHWQIKFDGDKVTYHELTAESARQILMEKQALFGVLDIFEDIGDFVVGVAEGIVDVVDTVVTKIGDAVTAAITFIVDGVTYLFNQVVQFVEQAFDVVEVLFAKVKVFFENVFKWLGFLFAWQDILRSQDALAHAADQFFIFIEGAIDGIQTIVDNGITNAKANLATIFDELLTEVGAASVGGYAKANQPNDPAASSALANNVVFNGLIDNAGAAQVSSTAIAVATGSSPFDTIVTNLKALAATVEADPAFAQAVTYMTNLGGSADQIFQQLISALLRILQGMANTILSGAQTIVDSLLQIFKGMVESLREILSAPWEIPFVSQFYSTFITNGRKLTTLDLIALSAAIPSTVLYKVLQGSAPFPNQASVDAFKASFTGASLLQNSGLGQTVKVASRSTDPGDPQTSTVTVFLGIGSLFCTWGFGILSAIMDVKPTVTPGKPDPLLETLAKWALACEILGQILCIPWFTSAGAPDCSTKDGSAKTLWIYESVGVLLDCGFTAYEKVFPENDGDWGVVVAEIYGIGHAITFGILAKNLSGWAITAKICMIIPETCKFLRLEAIQKVSDETSLLVIAGLDCFGYLISGVASFVDGVTGEARTDLLEAMPGAVPLPA